MDDGRFGGALAVMNNWHTCLKYNTQPDMLLDDQKDDIFVTLMPKRFEWDQLLEGPKRQGIFSLHKI